MKLDQEKMNTEEVNEKLSSDVMYLMKTKDYLESELEEERWKASKAEELAEGLSEKSSELSRKIMGLNEDLLNEQEMNNKLSENCKELEHQVEMLKNELLSKESKEKELLSNIKGKSENEYSLGK